MGTQMDTQMGTQIGTQIGTRLGTFRFLDNSDDPSNHGESDEWCEATDPRSKEVFYYHTATLETRSDPPADFDPRSDEILHDIRRVRDSVREAVACWSRKAVFVQLQTSASFADNMGPLIENEGWGFDNKTQETSLKEDGTSHQRTVTLVLWLESARQAELITAGINQGRGRNQLGREDAEICRPQAGPEDAEISRPQAADDVRFAIEHVPEPDDPVDRDFTAVDFLQHVARHMSHQEQETTAQSLTDAICDEILGSEVLDIAEDSCGWLRDVQNAILWVLQDAEQGLLELEVANSCSVLAEECLQERRTVLDIQADEAGRVCEEMMQSVLDVECRDLARTEFKAAVIAAPDPRDTRVIAPHVPHTNFTEFMVEKKPLAHGSFKSVYKATWSTQKNRWVVILAIRNTSNANLSDLQNEIEVFSVLGKHRHLAELLATTTHPSGDKCMVMEFAEQGSLDNVLTSAVENDIVPGNQVLLTIAVQVADAMMQLELHKVIHRDLAARNILVFHFDATDWTKVLVKVTDYGLALLAEKGSTAGKMVSTHGVSLAGPIRWMAPESLQRRLYSTKSDVWAYGVLLWEILTLGLVPYHAIPTDEAVAEAVLAGRRLPRPDDCSEAVWAVMLSCWREKAKDRPAMADILAKLQVAFAAELFKASECVICLEKEAVVAFIPCGHRCTCEGCAPSLRCCPVCRQPIREANRIFV